MTVLPGRLLGSKSIFIITRPGESAAATTVSPVCLAGPGSHSGRRPSTPGVRYILPLLAARDSLRYWQRVHLRQKVVRVGGVAGSLGHRGAPKRGDPGGVAG